jgi:protein-tyrosine phosphatase
MNDIFWIVGDPPARLAIVPRPLGGKLLKDELLRLKRGGIEVLVSMIEEWEAHDLGLADEGQLAESMGLIFLSHPLPDRQTPPEVSAFRGFATGLAMRLGAGECVGIHCRGSIGRSTLAAACALIHQGWAPEAALAAIELARGCPVPDTREQRDWILRYEAMP